MGGRFFELEGSQVVKQQVVQRIVDVTRQHRGLDKGGSGGAQAFQSGAGWAAVSAMSAIRCRCVSV